MTCTDGTDWATASTKECLEVVRIVMVIFLFWSFSETLLGWCSARCNFSPNLLAVPDAEWRRRNLHLCFVRLWAFYLCVRAGGRSLFPRLMFRSTHSGVRQVEWIKKTLLLNEIWQETATWFTSGCQRFISVWVRYATRHRGYKNKSLLLLINKDIHTVLSIGAVLALRFRGCLYDIQMELLCVFWRDVAE